MFKVSCFACASEHDHGFDAVRVGSGIDQTCPVCAESLGEGRDLYSWKWDESAEEIEQSNSVRSLSLRLGAAFGLN